MRAWPHTPRSAAPPAITASARASAGTVGGARLATLALAGTALAGALSLGACGASSHGQPDASSPVESDGGPHDSGKGGSGTGGSSGSGTGGSGTGSSGIGSGSGSGGESGSGSGAHDGGAPGTTELPGPSAALLANPTYSLGIGTVYSCTKNFYVDGSAGSDSNDGTAASTAGGHGPWATIQHADSATRTGGDCINVASGTYMTSGIELTHGGTEASPTGYVAYRCQSLDTCHVLYNGSAAGVIWNFQGSHYVVVDGFELDGNGDDTVYGSSYGGIPSTCFFSQQAPQYGHTTSHHIWMLNNKIHDCNLGGIGFQSTEYIFAIHNDVYNNAWTSGYEGSGIGLVVMQPLGASSMGETYMPNPYPTYTPTSQDMGFAPFHIITAWNVVHDNGEATTLGATVALTTTGNTHTSATLDGLGSVAGLAASQLVVGPGIQPFTYVDSIAGSTVTLSRPATATGNGSFQFLTVSINHTDGNGIIYDTWAGTADGCQDGCNANTYPNQSLIVGNASYHNGGRGIHVFATSNVTIANNSVYANGIDINRQPGSTASDLSQAGGKANQWVNNVAVSVLTQPNKGSDCLDAINGTNYYCGGQNMPLIAGDARGITDTNNTYLHNVLQGGIGVNLWNNDVGYFTTTDNIAAAVYNSYPYTATAVFTGADQASAVYADPGSGTLTLAASSPAAGYGMPESYVPTWLKNAGAY